MATNAPGNDWRWQLVRLPLWCHSGNSRCGYCRPAQSAMAGHYCGNPQNHLPPEITRLLSTKTSVIRVRLTLLAHSRAVNPVQPDFLDLAVVQNLDRVAIRDANHTTGKVGGKDNRCYEQNRGSNWGQTRLLQVDHLTQSKKSQKIESDPNYSSKLMICLLSCATDKYFRKLNLSRFFGARH